MDTVNTDKTSRKIWNFFDSFQGDKVLWMIVMLLMSISLITIFASASGLADEAKEISRLNIFFSQFKLACMGMLLIILIYLCNRNKIPVQKQQIHDIMLFCTGSDPFPVRLRCAGCVYFIVPSR